MKKTYLLLFTKRYEFQNKKFSAVALRRFMYKYLKSRNICLTFLFCFNIEGNFLMIKTKNDVKNTVSWDFWPFFAIKIRPGPRMKRQKPFCQLFNFREDIQSPSAKILCACIRWLRRHTIFSLDTEVLIFLNYGYWVCKHTQIPYIAWMFL